ncbi:MAG: hypothetical protein GY809_16450 [Planctomycetes bacterium]|nr:hypothetical protein [Planctomycetota bacterium]
MRHANEHSQKKARFTMNWLLLAVVSALGLMLPPAWAVDKSLVLYLPLDEGQGTTATDASSYQNNGDIVGNAQWVDGHIGMALEFVNGSHVVVPEIPEHDIASELSVMTWVKNTGTAGWARLIDKSQWQTSGFDLILTDGAAIPRFEFFVNNTTSMVDATAPVIDGEWHFVAATFGSQTLRMYLDGMLEGESESTGGVDINPNDWPIMVGAESSSNGGWQFIGTLDDVAVFNRELNADEILAIYENGITDPSLASQPEPRHKAQDIIRDSALSWTSGEFAGTHNVFIGQSAEAVTEATVPTESGLNVNSFDPGRLALGETYFWRVDEVNATPDKTVFKGDTWRFEVEPYSVQIPGTAIGVSASSSAASGTSDPIKTIDGSGLDPETGAHSTDHADMWFSNSPDVSAWLMYEFDSVKQLDVMNVWNCNSSAEPAIGWGLKNVRIEYSVDGVAWTVLEGADHLNQASGVPEYNQYDTVAFNKAPARWVRINILSSFGGYLPAYALSEVQFFAIPVQASEPNPADQAVEVMPDGTATWRAGREAVIHKVLVSLDAGAVPEGSLALSATHSIDMVDLGLVLGETYYWQVVEVNLAEVPAEWPSKVWTFTTAERIMVDDFESYNNASPDRPFQTWLDGIGYSADEHFPAEYPGNDTGAAVGHDIWSMASPHYQGDITEQILTAEGSGQSLPIYYTGGSEVDRIFATPQNWSMAGIATLVVPFRGDRDNAAGQIYATINGQRVDYPKASALTLGVWTPWHINLASLGIALDNVTTLTIGIESGGSGLLLVDQISLYRRAPEVPVSVDPGTLGLEAMYSFEGDFKDSSGHGLDGIPSGGPLFFPGLPGLGSAASFNGTDDSVTLPVGPLVSTLTDCTFALWANFPGGGGVWQRIIDFGSGPGQYVFISPSRGGDEALLFEMNGPTAGTNLVSAPLKLPSGWHHVAGVINSATMQMTLYLDGVAVAQGPTDSVPSDMGETTQNWIGRSQFFADPTYNGSLDDLRIYNRVLSEGEIRYLAGDR